MNTDDQNPTQMSLTMPDTAAPVVGLGRAIRAEVTDTRPARDKDRARLYALADQADELEGHLALARNNARLALEQRNDYRDNPRDEHHTMTELYEYRMLYNAHAAHRWAVAGLPVVKSRRHHDGELCFGGGWFIVTATLPTGQVSNHYEEKHWDLFVVPAVDQAPEWDGHTPADAATRLRAALLTGGGARGAGRAQAAAQRVLDEQSGAAQ